MSEDKAQDALDVIETKIREAKNARAERDAANLAEIATMFDPDEHVKPIKIDSPASVIGYVLVRRANKQEISKYVTVLHRDPNKPGQVEERVKNGPQLARNCLVWPDTEKYDAMVALCGAVPQMIASRILEVARGKAEAEEKD
jgi:hypothetical protein